MMRVDIRHRFEGATVPVVEELYMLDEEFNRRVFEQLGFQRRALTITRRGQLLERTLRLCPQQALPRPFSALMPNTAFSICEQVHYDFSTHCGTWSTQPSVLAKQFRAEGTCGVAQEGSAVVFWLTGSATATIPLLSARAERQAVSIAEQQHAGLASAVREQLSAHARPRGAAAQPD